MTELSVIVPVYNEAGNIARLVEEVTGSLANYDFELIIVDLINCRTFLPINFKILLS